MRLYRFFLLSFAVNILVASFPNLTFGISKEEIVANVQKAYQGTKDFKADFIQESTLKSINKTQVGKGKIYFKHPGKLRWDYNDTTKQEIVTDGKTLWMYIPQDKQVIINELSKVYRSNTSTFFLSGMGDLKRDFDIELAENPSQNKKKGFLLKLIPKEQQPNINELFLLVDKSTFHVKETYFYDFYENLIRIKFKNSAINKGLPDSLFVFTIPEGVEIVSMPQISQDQ